MSSAKVRLALVGCGGISEYHITGYRALFENNCREFEVTACCDPNTAGAETRAGQIAAFQGSKPAIFSDTDQLIRAGIADAADICAPHYLHHTLAIPLLEAGRHVMVEKPLGLTLKTAQKIIQVARRKKRTLAVAENIRRFVQARACAWAIRESGLIGDIKLGLVQSVNRQPFDYDNPAFKWRGVKLLCGGGMIMDSGAHFADMMLVLFGEPDEVSCVTTVLDRRIIRGAPVVGDVAADVEDGWHAVIRFPKGPVISWTYSRSFYEPAVNQAAYYGERGTIRDLGFPFHPFQTGGEIALDDGSKIAQPELEKKYLQTVSPEKKERLFPYGCTDGAAVEVWDFVNSVRENREPEINGETALRVKAICEALYESSWAGTPVKYLDVLNRRLEAYQRPIDEFWKI